MIDTFLAAIRSDALTALLAPATWVRGVLRRRRQRRIYQADMLVLTRQEDMNRSKFRKLRNFHKPS